MVQIWPHTIVFDKVGPWELWPLFQRKLAIFGKPIDLLSDNFASWKNLATFSKLILLTSDIIKLC